MGKFTIDANVHCEFSGAEVVSLGSWTAVQLVFRLIEDTEAYLRQPIFIPKDEPKATLKGRTFHFVQECEEVAKALGVSLEDIVPTGDQNIYAKHVAAELDSVRGVHVYVKSVPNGEYVNGSKVRPWISKTANLVYGENYKGVMEYVKPGGEMPADLMEDTAEEKVETLP